MIQVSAAVCEGAADPNDASRHFERFVDAADGVIATFDADSTTVLNIACCRAPYLAKLLTRDPTRLKRVVDGGYLHREKPASVCAEELKNLTAACDDDDDFARVLRVYRADEIVRLGVRELQLATPAEVGRELSHLADACLDVSVDFHDAQLRKRFGVPVHNGGREQPAFTVVAMGKLGGQELNFTSDIDVIYFYSFDDGSAGELSLHEYYSKLAHRVTSALSEVTDEDIVFRVDLRLRPEGSRGPIANSLPSAEHYYESWGRAWERQAWLKARACAGSKDLGDEVLRTMLPFMYPRTVSADVISTVNDLNKRIKAELVGGDIDHGFDLKNGSGGIREVEFFVQALQLVHGGHQATIRSRATRNALDQLLFAGLISQTEHATLREAYDFLRRAEHLRQLESGRQTQRLPSTSDELKVFAKRMDFATTDEFLAQLTHHTKGVSELFESLGDPDPGVPAEAELLASGRLSPERELAALSALGFRNPQHSQKILESAQSRSGSPLAGSATGVRARLAARMMAEIASSPDPDQTLVHFSTMIARYGPWSALWRMFDDNGNLLRLIASVFGSSEYLSRLFVDHPELLDGLLSAGQARTRISAQELDETLTHARTIIDTEDEEGHWNALAEFKHTQTLRIGLADIAGALSATDVVEELTKVADVCLSQAFDVVTQSLMRRAGVARQPSGEPATFAVLALGKLGARELGYASDLDLVFVYSGDGQSDGARSLDNVTYMTRLAQRLMSGLHAMHPGGRIYEVDTRLRPAGSKGLLVSSEAAWHSYHRSQAALWERQALTKLRFVAGDQELGQRISESAINYAYLHHESLSHNHIAQKIRAMRARIEHELAGTTSSRDLKAGRGGLMDIEFAAQFLALVHGSTHPEMRRRSTLAVLANAAKLNLCDKESAEILSQGYVFLRTVENRLRIVHDRSVNTLPDRDEEVEMLARRCGYASAEEFVETYTRWTQQIRQHFSQTLGTDA